MAWQHLEIHAKSNQHGLQMQKRQAEAHVPFLLTRATLI